MTTRGPHGFAVRESAVRPARRQELTRVRLNPPPALPFTRRADAARVYRNPPTSRDDSRSAPRTGWDVNTINPNFGQVEFWYGTLVEDRAGCPARSGRSGPGSVFRRGTTPLRKVSF